MQVAGSISEDPIQPFLEVRGQNVLSGHIKVSGAKNSALVLMAASLLTKESVHLTNIPELTDIDVMAELLYSTGADIRRTGKNLKISNPFLSIGNTVLAYELVHALRASFVCIGPILARLGEVKIPLPGGCRIGSRPVDEHIKGLKELGANVRIEDGYVIAKSKGPERKLIGTRINLGCKSVGATETLMMAATLAKGSTIINGAAQEPEIQDLANLLKKMGAKIKGAGTNQIKIEGVSLLKGCKHKVIPDRIEAGTFLIASAITRCPLTITPVITTHLKSVISKLEECGCSIIKKGNGLRIIPSKIIKGVNVTTSPFPGFPTDLQAPYMALMSTCEGTSKITETVFEERMQHVGELNKMGSKIDLNQNIAIINGVKELCATSVSGGDLRSSAAMVLATLNAKGTSQIRGLEHLDRGYENFEQKLRSIGANISRQMGLDKKKLMSQRKESVPKHNFYSRSKVA